MRFVEACEAMGDPVRARLFYLLSHGEHCVCELVETMDLPQSTVSRHLSRLREASLITERRDGTWRYYSLNRDYKATEAFLKLLESEGAAQLFKKELDRMVRCGCKV